MSTVETAVRDMMNTLQSQRFTTPALVRENDLLTRTLDPFLACSFDGSALATLLRFLHHVVSSAQNIVEAAREKGLGHHSLLTLCGFISRIYPYYLFCCALSDVQVHGKSVLAVLEVAVSNICRALQPNTHLLLDHVCPIALGAVSDRYTVEPIDVGLEIPRCTTCNKIHTSKIKAEKIIVQQCVQTVCDDVHSFGCKLRTAVSERNYAEIDEEECDRLQHLLKDVLTPSKVPAVTGLGLDTVKVPPCVLKIHRAVVDPSSPVHLNYSQRLRVSSFYVCIGLPPDEISTALEKQYARTKGFLRCPPEKTKEIRQIARRNRATLYTTPCKTNEFCPFKGSVKDRVTECTKCMTDEVPDIEDSNLGLISCESQTLSVYERLQKLSLDK